MIEISIFILYPYKRSWTTNYILSLWKNLESHWLSLPRTTCQSLFLTSVFLKKSIVHDQGKGLHWVTPIGVINLFIVIEKCWDHWKKSLEKKVYCFLSFHYNFFQDLRKDGYVNYEIIILDDWKLYAFHWTAVKMAAWWYLGNASFFHFFHIVLIHTKFVHCESLSSLKLAGWGMSIWPRVSWMGNEIFTKNLLSKWIFIWAHLSVREKQNEKQNLLMRSCVTEPRVCYEYFSIVKKKEYFEILSQKIYSSYRKRKQ